MSTPNTNCALSFVCQIRFTCLFLLKFLFFLASLASLCHEIYSVCVTSLSTVQCNIIPKLQTQVICFNKADCGVLSCSSCCLTHLSVFGLQSQLVPADGLDVSGLGQDLYAFRSLHQQGASGRLQPGSRWKQSSSVSDEYFCLMFGRVGKLTKLKTKDWRDVNTPTVCLLFLMNLVRNLDLLLFFFSKKLNCQTD